MIKTIQDLEVYTLSHKLAMDIFEITKKFPTEEKYSLIDQIRRSSRSIAVNLAEGWGRREYEQSFKRFIVDSIGSLEETKAWIAFSLDCQYINIEQNKLLYEKLDELGAKLHKLHSNWHSI